MSLLDSLFADKRPLRASEWLSQLLTGEIGWNDAPEAVRSWAALYIHDAAKQVLALPKEKRRAAMDKLPGDLIPKLEAEVKRLWQWRRDHG